MPRLRVDISGLVQGIGFRPFVYREAARFSLSGFVHNVPSGVAAEVEGGEQNLKRFLAAVRANCPAAGRIDQLNTTNLTETGAAGFRILTSRQEQSGSTAIPVDLCLCQQCKSELYEPGDRRYLYPLINCMHCGPRFSIIDALPYDRARTSMRDFSMCPACAGEYENPLDRRFHAEPVSCFDCGPKLSLLDAQGIPLGMQDPIHGAAGLIAQGKIVAVKGLGGYHLVVDATNDRAVRELRARKKRPGKAFAVMFANFDLLAKEVQLFHMTRAVLSRVEAPIVLLPKQESGMLSQAIAPDNPCLGVFLPYTPIQYLLFFPDADSHSGQQPRFTALVMTSGSLTDEPIAIAEDEAVVRLSGVADAYLVHDRRILQRADDAVIAQGLGATQEVRLGRGNTPATLELPEELPPVLAFGGELKNTLCLLDQRRAIVSQHIGDLEHAQAIEFCRRTAENLLRFYRVEPAAVACDMHPRYFSRQLAQAVGKPLIEVQHHHAHLAAAMAEYGLRGKTLGVILDGTGYGADGTVWGCEWLLADERDYLRLAHLKNFTLAGGDTAVMQPWRAALSLAHSFALELPQQARQRYGAENCSVVRQLLEKQLRTVNTSSAGRLFDGVASLIGVKDRVSFGAEAAIALEDLAGRSSNDKDFYKFDIAADKDQLTLDPTPSLRQLLADLEQGHEYPSIARRFHLGFGRAIAQLTAKLATQHALSQAVLSGGCFQNQLLLKIVLDKLHELGIAALVPRRFPVNDAGISLGQAYIAAHRCLAPKLGKTKNGARHQS